MNKFSSPRIWIIMVCIILSGMCCIITAAALELIDSCPDDLAEEEYSDEIAYETSDEANESALLDAMNAKYCEWAVAGNCYRYDSKECSKYGVFLPGTYLTSETTYILKDGKPGILVLLGAWEQVDNTTKPVPDTDINLRIYEKNPFNVHIHKVISTGEDGQAFFEWIWGDLKSDWNNEWVLEYSHGDFIEEKSFYSEVNATQNFPVDINILNKSPNTRLYQ